MKTSVRLFKITISIWMILLLSGCGTGSSSSSSGLTGIFFSQNKVLLATIGAQQQLSPLGIDSADTIDPNIGNISWGSSNASVVSVSTAGVITAQANGAAVVTATHESLSTTVTIIVQDLNETAATGTNVVSIIVDPSSLLLTNIGDSALFNAYIVLEDGSLLYNSAGISWQSMDNSVTTVDSTGVVTALADGVTQIRASFNGFETSVQVMINSNQTAAPQTAVAVTVDSNMLYTSDVASTRQLNFLIYDQYLTENTTPQSISWVSEDEAIVSVDSSGLVTFNGDGATNIVLTVDGISTKVVVIVDTTLKVISGRVQYEDMLYDINGFTGSNPTKPIRGAAIHLVDTLSLNIISTTMSAQDGLFQFNDIPNGDYYLRVTASNGNPAINAVAVKDLSGLIYSVTQDVLFDGSEVGMNIIATEASIGGAFNIYDVMLAAEEVAHTLSSDLIEFLPLNLFWSDTNITYGTYTCRLYDATWCRQGVGIYILGGDRGRSDDTDDYDDDVLWHEFTHFLEYNLGIDDSPGGAHFLTDNTLDLRLAWSEGFADYWSLFTRSYLKANSSLNGSQVPSTLPSSTYVDTEGYLWYLRFDIDQPSASQIYSSNEVAVAKLLLELEKIAGITSTFGSLWQLMPVSTSQANLEQFWDGWLSGVDATQADLGQTAAFERQINYFEDLFEVDDTSADVGAVDCLAAATCYEEEHTLYLDSGVADNDVVVLNVSQNMLYTVETLYLKNGADTILQVLDGSGKQYAIESGNLDDAYPVPCDFYGCYNTSTGLASKVVIQPSADGVMEIDVRTPVDPYLFSGEYGTYTLKITAQ